MGERWLVTGARGFLGRHACDALRDRGYVVVPLDRSPPEQPGGLVADLGTGVPDLGEEPFDVVVHLASLVHHDASGADFERAILDGTGHLLEGLDRLSAPPKSVIYASTVAVYGLEEGENVPESTPTEAESAYGGSKWKAERAIADWATARGVKASMLRLPGIVGAGMAGSLAALVGALRSRSYVGVGPGTARRSLVMAGDVAAALPRLAELEGPLHLTDRHHPSFLELEAAICRELGRRAPHRIPSFAARGVALAGDLAERLGANPRFTSDTYRRTLSTLTFDDSRAVRLIGWSPTPVLEAIDVWMPEAPKPEAPDPEARTPEARA